MDRKIRYVDMAKIILKNIYKSYTYRESKINRFIILHGKKYLDRYKLQVEVL